MAAEGIDAKETIRRLAQQYNVHPEEVFQALKGEAPKVTPKVTPTQPEAQAAATASPPETEVKSAADGTAIDMKKEGDEGKSENLSEKPERRVMFNIKIIIGGILTALSGPFLYYPLYPRYRGNPDQPEAGFFLFIGLLLLIFGGTVLAKGIKEYWRK